MISQFRGILPVMNSDKERHKATSATCRFRRALYNAIQSLGFFKTKHSQLTFDTSTSGFLKKF